MVIVTAIMAFLCSIGFTPEEALRIGAFFSVPINSFVCFAIIFTGVTEIEYLYSNKSVLRDIRGTAVARYLFCCFGPSFITGVSLFFVSPKTACMMFAASVCIEVVSALSSDSPSLTSFASSGIVRKYKSRFSL